MKKEKNSAYVLITFIIVVILCVLGYFYLVKRNDESGVTIQAVSKDAKEVKGLNEMLSEATFVNGQKEIELEDFDGTMNISVKIENQTIAIRALDKSVNVTDIKDPVSVSTFLVGGEDSLPVDVYVLNKEGKLHRIYFFAGTSDDKSVHVIEFALPDVESYSTNVKDIENHEAWTNFVVAKTKDGKYYTDYDFLDDEAYTFRRIYDADEEIEEETDEEKDEYTYGIYSTGDVNPFKDLDYNQRIVSATADDLDFDSSSITYNGYYMEDDDERTQKVVIKVKDVKQVGIMCDETAGPCDEIIYLTSSGKLYGVKALDGGYFEKDSDGSFKRSTVLIDTNVKSFALIPVISYDVSTGGEKNIVYKKNDDKTYINVGEKSYNADSYKKIWIGDTYTNTLYVVSKTAKVDKYIQNKDGKNLVAKKIYSFYGSNEDGDGEDFIYLYILNEDNYLYELDDYINEKAVKFSNKKVKSITERDDDILVTFEDDTTEVIDAYLEYEVK